MRVQIFVCFGRKRWVGDGGIGMGWLVSGNIKFSLASLLNKLKSPREVCSQPQHSVGEQSHLGSKV